jgi:hypothetical protein
VKVNGLGLIYRLVHIVSISLSVSCTNRVWAENGIILDPPTHQYTRNEMTNITLQAVTKRDDVRLLMKNSENLVTYTCNKYGIDQRLFIPVGTIGTAWVTRKITTRGIHMYYSPIKDLTIRPDVDYYFKGGSLFQLTIGLKF